jgi:hypothetical protein
MTKSALRWGRIALGGFLAELILIVVVIPMRAAGSGETFITAVAVAGSFLVFVPVARWLARGLSRPVPSRRAHGGGRNGDLHRARSRGQPVYSKRAADSVHLLRGARAQDSWWRNRRLACEPPRHSGSSDTSANRHSDETSARRGFLGSYNHRI